MKVIKFGGSSLASASQVKKVLDIVKSDPERRFVVVSAPGKRSSDDTKVTDALIAYYHNYVNEQDVTADQAWIIDRYQSMARELQVSDKVMDVIRQSIVELANLPVADNAFLYDTFLAAGEDNNAKLIADYFRQNGLSARYVHPREAGMVVSSEPGNAQLLATSYNGLQKLRHSQDILIVPGFFGVTVNDEICTFSRGGSDITGSILAAGIQADCYENFTDVDGIFAAHPGVVDKPHSIKELTYREMRELAYAGFSVLHDEALIPAYRGKIPIIIKNTNNPSHPGTRIVLQSDKSQNPVVGVSGDGDFVSINISKYLMNRELGFGRKVLQVLEELDIRFEHMPTGIDDLSIVLKKRELTPIKEQEIINQLTRNLEVDSVSIQRDLSIIMIVGEQMKNHIGITATATKALSDAGINLVMISQGASEVSVMFVVKTEDEKPAVKALYQAFFKA